MIPNEISDPESQNQESYEDLLVAIEANQGRLGILIAVCNDSNLRDEIIGKYEAELAPDIRNYRIELPRGEPSIKTAISEAIKADDYLQKDGKAVLTVTGAEKLFFLKLGNERSEQEIFFGYLQWTREALREFSYPIVLWVTNQILVELTKKAPDFWSWRKGVFRFASKRTVLIPNREIAPFRLFLERNILPIDKDDDYFLPLEDLQQLIQKIEKDRGNDEPLLATLYERTADIYKRRMERREAQDFQKERELAIQYYRKAIELDKKLGLETRLFLDLENLATFYFDHGLYSEAETLYLQALEFNHPIGQDYAYVHVAGHLHNLANVYFELKQYSKAENLYLKALEVYKHTPETENDILVPGTLTNLGSLYASQGRYNEAEQLFLQALKLNISLSEKRHTSGISVVFSLEKLALLYQLQGRYSEAEQLLLQALELAKKLLVEIHPIITTIRHHLERLRAK